MFTIGESTIYNYTSIYFHYITFQVSSNQMLLWNSGTQMEILLCGIFPAEETRVNDMAQTISIRIDAFIYYYRKFQPTKNDAN